MIYKLITLIIDELITIGSEPKASIEFKQDIADAIKALRKIKKYF